MHPCPGGRALQGMMLEQLFQSLYPDSLLYIMPVYSPRVSW